MNPKAQLKQTDLMEVVCERENLKEAVQRVEGQQRGVRE